MKTETKLKAKAARKPRAGQLFAWFCVAILLGTSLFWAILSARLQNLNADNLIDSYLFDSWRTFHAATFPGAHTFLLKWPVFLLSAMLGSTLSVITVLTVVCTLSPIAVLVYLLHKIEPRRSVFGLWCLALSSILLLVPAQPSPGTLLPVNFAMLATRNLEYAVFIAMLALLVSSKRWRDKKLLAATGLGIVLAASDKIFVPYIVASVFGVAVIALLQRPKQLAKLRPHRSRMLRWIIVAFVSVVGAYALLALIAATHFTGIEGQGTTSPYGFSLTLHVVATALGYAVMSLFTLFGANAAYDQLKLTAWPHDFIARTDQISSIGYLLNGILLILMLFGTIVFVWRYLRTRKAASNHMILGAMLLFASVASLLIYVVTNHYYPADSRYLAIALFALIVPAAQTLARVKLPRRTLGLAGVVLLASLPFSIAASHTQYDKSQQAMRQQSAFNLAVAQKLNAYHVDVVIGNYWDVTPIRSVANYSPTIVPLGSCTLPQSALSSKAWQQAPRRASVGYVLNNAPQLTGFPHCTEAEVIKAFGQPTRRIAIKTPGHAGSLLFVYDNRIKQVVTKKATPPAPVSQDFTAYDKCQQGNLLGVVAHEDDDILFMNPDLQTAVTSGECVTSVYLTAGDAGNDGTYPEGRREGSQAAYAQMYHVADHWKLQRRQLNGMSVRTYTLQYVPQVQLVFFDLPDGNIKGQGFPAHHFESLAQLRSGKISAITSNDGFSSYTASGLVDSLAKLMSVVQPIQVHTQDYSSNINDGDHSDHHAAGYFTKLAFAQYGGPGQLFSYIGYPGGARPANVKGDDLAHKKATFYTYGMHDPGVCTSDASCQTTAYKTYLQRQYSRAVVSRDISSAHTHTGISSDRSPQQVLTHNAGGTCATSNAPHSLYCTSGR